MRIKGSNMAEEIFDIVDENGQPTGETVTRSKAHAEGIRHASHQVMRGSAFLWADWR
jgi:hypothetical protein